MEFVLDGYCGLYCGACPALLGTKAGTEANPCYGCKSECVRAGHCVTCDIKMCARQRGYSFCDECQELSHCEKMQTFMADEKWPYHAAVIKNFELIRLQGIDKWLEGQEKRWQCANCGTSQSWWDETCQQCGQAVENYRADISR
jgi:hypothetical protein